MGMGESLTDRKPQKPTTRVVTPATVLLGTSASMKIDAFGPHRVTPVEAQSVDIDSCSRT